MAAIYPEDLDFEPAAATHSRRGCVTGQRVLPDPQTHPYGATLLFYSGMEQEWVIYDVSGLQMVTPSNMEFWTLHAYEDGTLYGTTDFEKRQHDSLASNPLIYALANSLQLR